MDLPEIGVRGEAVVTGVEPCPAILPGPGKVVLTTFHHASSDLIDLYLSPQPPTGSLTAQQTAVDALLYPQVSRASVVDQAWERIGVTGNHPIWSEDRHDNVAAMDLRVGERLKNLSGDTVWVQQKLPRPDPTPVYNLEVQDEHVYYVGANGVLAHNAGQSKKRKRGANCEQNAKEGADREKLVHDSLSRYLKDTSVQNARYLRTADGKIAIDPLTGQGRRIDHAVIKDGVVRYLVETTSKTADKAAQLDKEERIRAIGGTFIRDKFTRELLDVSNIRTRLSRRR